MNIKLIKTEEGYQLALQRLEEIFDAEPGTQEGDELEVLISRDGILQALTIKVLKDTRVRFKFEKVQNPTAEQQKIYNKWLGIRNS